jgi:1,2-diacylglycerol 3-alpha-glucosyltransferase
MVSLRIGSHGLCQYAVGMAAASLTQSEPACYGIAGARISSGSGVLPMRIALFTECYLPVINGVVVSVSTCARELTRQGHEVRVFAPAYPGYQETDSRVHRLPSLSLSRSAYPLAWPRVSRRTRQVLSAYQPDIVHANHPFLTGRMARLEARRLVRPLVFTYHTLVRAYAHYLPLPRGLVEALAVRWSRSFSNASDCVIVPTQGIAEVLRSYGVERRIEVIPTGIDLEAMRAESLPPCRSRFGLPESVPVICYAGRIASEKSVDVLLRAFARVSERHREAHLLLVGGGPWLPQCRAMAEALGAGERVRFTGYVSQQEVFSCLAEATLLAFPSLTDTQGLVVLEAMALGCPPVAARSGAVADIVRDGVDGLVVDPTEEGMAEGMDRVLSSPELRSRLGGKARRHAEEFAAGKMIARLLQVYASLLESG